MSPKTKISRQYFQKRVIPVTILQVIHPAHFIVKECITETSSLEAKNFLEAEEAMQKYYGSLESDIYQLPLKDTVLVALVMKKFYRARVNKILLKTDGHHFRLYLLDYGRECEVAKDNLYGIQKDFLAHPFQAVEFKLIGLEPISLIINPLDLSFSSGPVEAWDVSAVGYIESLTKENLKFTIQVKGIEDACIVGSLFYQDECGIKCVNNELVERKYAQYKEENVKNVQSIDVIIENEIHPKDKIESKSARKKTMVNPVETALLENACESMSSVQLSSNNRLSQPLTIKCDSPEPSDNLLNHNSVMITPSTIVPENTKELPKSNSTFQKLLKLHHSKSPKVLPSNEQSSGKCTVSSDNVSPSEMLKAVPVKEQSKSSSPNKNIVTADKASPSKSMNSPSARHIHTPTPKDFGMLPRKLWKSPLQNVNYEIISNFQSPSDDESTTSSNSALSPRILNLQNMSPVSSSESQYLSEQKLSPRIPSYDQSNTITTESCISRGTQNSHLNQTCSLPRMPNADQIGFGNFSFAAIHSSSPRMFSLSPRLQYSGENISNSQCNNLVSAENPSASLQEVSPKVQSLSPNSSTMTSPNHLLLHKCTLSPRIPNFGQSRSAMLNNACTSPSNSLSLQKHSLSPSMTNTEQNNLNTNCNDDVSSEALPSVFQKIISPPEKIATPQNKTISPVSIVTLEKSTSRLLNQSLPSISNRDENKSGDPSTYELDVSFKSPSKFKPESKFSHSPQDSIVLSQVQLNPTMPQICKQEDKENYEVKPVFNVPCNGFVEEIGESKPTCKSTNVDKIKGNSLESGSLKELKPTVDKNLQEKFLKYKKLLISRKSNKVLLQGKERNEKSSESPLTSLDNLLNSNQTENVSNLDPSTLNCKEALFPADKNENTSESADSCDITSSEKHAMSFSRYKNIILKKKKPFHCLENEQKVLNASSSGKEKFEKNISVCDSNIFVKPEAKIESGINYLKENNESKVEEICLQSNSQTLGVESEKEAVPTNKTINDNQLENASNEIDNALCISSHLNQNTLLNNDNFSDRSTRLSDLSDTDNLLLASLKPKKMSISDKSDCCETQEGDFTPNYTHMTNTDFSSLWEKQEVPALQIGDVPPQPIKTTDEANFPSSLLKILKNIKFVGPTCIQSVVWPAIWRHRNVIAIAPPHAGKSVAYILPIASQFHSLHYEDLPSGNGPIAIILCSSWKAVQSVYELCRLFMQDAHVKIITLYADGRKFKNKIANILNGCDVLIATPYEFLQAVKDKVVDFSRCCHLIMDDGDKLVTHNKKELRDILLTFVEEVKEKRLETVPSMVLCAERWNKTFAYINKTLMTCPMLCFTSFLEAAVYAEVPFFTHVCTTADKKSTLLGILENSNVVICVTKAEEALDVYNFLSCESIRTHLVTEGMEHHTSSEKMKDWKSVHSSISPNCLIITDAALTLMPVSNAKCLIHYDIPKESRLQFGNRFSCIAENFLHKDEELHLSCHVLISEYCPLLASSLIDVIKRSCGYIPDILKKIASENKEPVNTSSTLCHYMKAFGCCKQKSCQQRHVIEPAVDAPKIVVKEGDVQAYVTHVVDASHYFVRILKYLLPGTETAVCLSAQYAKTGFLLSKFYASECNRKVVKDITIGKSYVIEEDGLFYRIKVLDIETSKFEQRKIKMLFIDEGWVKLLEKVILYDLPHNLELPSPFVVEVYLCNVTTLDSCPDWNPQANNYISNLILKKEIYGKIMLCIGETLWLHPIALRTKLCFLNEYLNVQRISKALVENGFAKENRNHLNLLLTACDGKVSVPNVINEFRKTEDTSTEQPQINYAFLECNVEEEIYVSSVISPHQLYIQRRKFTDCLDDLILKVNVGVEKNKYPKCKNFHLGMYCIAPFHEDNKFYRALITDVTSDNENVDLFYIDFGDNGVASKKDIYVIEPELLLHLPCQAIECELRDVNATHGGWSEKAINYLTDLTRDDEGDMKILTLKAYKKETSYGGGNHYIVDIWDGAKSLSECLVQAGLAEPVETLLPAEPPIETKEQSFDDEPPGYAESSDDRDPEDKDCEALFCCVLSKLLLEGNKYSNANEALADAIRERESQAKSQPTITEEKDEKNESPSPVSNVSNSSERRDEKCSVPLPSKHPFILKILNRLPKSRSPLISWWDTPNQLHIAIHVKDITTYNLELYDHGFKFHTCLKNVVYSAEEQFYSNVHSQDAVKQLTAQALNLSLHKQESEKWPRFTKECKKFVHIKYNLEHLDDSESDENVSINSTAKNNYPSKDCDIAPYPSDESHESSTDHEEKYVEPWRKMATYKDPYDPLD